MLDLATVTADVFRPHAGTPFTVIVSGAEAVEVILLGVTEFESGRPGVRRGFSLMFGGGTTARILPQATYSLRHETLGELGIFIVPRTPVDGEPRYEATFN